MEQGTHDDLISRRGAYHKLVEKQLVSTKLGEDIKKTKDAADVFSFWGK